MRFIMLLLDAGDAKLIFGARARDSKVAPPAGALALQNVWGALLAVISVLHCHA
jgi:hypothetical protein